MPTPDTSAVNVQINAALTELTKVDPFPVKVDVLLQLDPFVKAGERIVANPRAIRDEVKGMLAELKKTALSVDVSLSVDVVASLDDLIALVERLRKAFTDGKVAAIDMPPLVKKLAGKIVDAIPPGLVTLAKKLKARSPQDALANLFTGSNSGALANTRKAIVAKVAEIAKAAEELLPITVRLESLTVTIDEIAASLALNPPDFNVIGPKLVKVDADLEVLIGDLTPLLRKIAAQLDAIDTTAFTAQLIQAFDAIAGALPDAPLRLSDLFDDLRDARDELDALANGDLQELIDENIAGVRTALEEAGIQDIGGTIRTAVEDAIDEVDLAGLKAHVTALLDEAKVSIDKATAELPKQLQDALAQLATDIQGIDVQKITDPIFGQLEDPIAKTYRKAIDDLAIEADKLIATVKDYVDQDLIDALDDIDTELQNLVKELDAIDFDAAAAESRRLMEEIRTNVEEAIRSADLPPAARTAISLGAQGLKSINFQESVAQPIQAELDKADPTPIIERLEAEVAKIREVLASVVFSELVQQLDPPFDRALEALEPYTHEALKARVAEEIAKFETFLDDFDPGPLLAQLESEHAKLVAAAKAQSDLSPLFQPIEDAYDRTIAAIAELKLPEFLDAVTEDIEAIPLQIETAVHEAMAEIAALTAQAPELHLGDILRPLAEVVEDLRAHLDSLSDAQLEAIATAVVAPVVFFQNLGDLHAVFGSNPVIAIDAAWDELTGTCESLDASMQAQIDAGNTTIDINLGVRLQAVTPDFTALVAAAQRLGDRIATPELIASANRLAAAIQAALPPELLAIDEETSPRAALELILDTIDPAPLVTELDQIGEEIDADLATCAQAIADGIIKLVHEVFGVVDPANVNAELQQTLTAIQGQLALLDPTPVKTQLQAIADSLVLLIEALSPAKMKDGIDQVLQAVRGQVQTTEGLILDAVDDLPPIPDLTGYRPSTKLASLEEATKNLQDRLDDILAFEFGEPLLRTLDRLRPALDKALDDLFVELDQLVQFLEKQNAA